MVVDFSKLNLKERQTLILKNQDGTYIQPLVFAHNLEAKLCYNEVSEITFDVPAYVDCLRTPSYDEIVGMRLIDWYGIGQFILMDPSTTNDGIKEIKTCKAYSLEYELTYKQIFLSENRYNFWNPFNPKQTVIGIILDLLPSWSAGSIDASLEGKYRSLDVSGTNVYEFIKNTLQDTYQCIFDFDTYNRKINVRAVSDLVDTKPVYLSLDNLIKEIQIEEDTQNIFTCLDVHGADGVDIHSVNPMGDNKIYNLDYFMNSTYFSQDMIDKWNAWKTKYEESQRPYYNLTIERVVKESQLVVEQAALTDLEGELKALETLQAVQIDAAAKDTGSSSEMAQTKQDIINKNEEIAAKKREIALIKAAIELCSEQQKVIKDGCKFEAFFASDELQLLNRYIKETSLSEESFVYQTVSSYSNDDSSYYEMSSSIVIYQSKIRKITSGDSKEIFTVTGGEIKIPGISIGIESEIIAATLEVNGEDVLFTAHLGNGENHIAKTEFNNACLTAKGLKVNLSSDVTDVEGIDGVYQEGTALSIGLVETHLCLTGDLTEYAKRSIEWDLFEFGKESLAELCCPTYTFEIDVANFLAMDEFVAFKNQFALGSKIYLNLNGKVLSPIAVGAELNADDPTSFKLLFGDKYHLNDSAFKIVDLLEQSINIGKTTASRLKNFNAFIESGASSELHNYINSALDAAKQAVLAGKNQSTQIDGSGIRCRYYNSETGTFDDEQIWIINNNIVFTKNNWDTAEMALGHIVDTKNNIDDWGLVANLLVGKMIAGHNLIIEAQCDNNKVVEFCVDREGVRLSNARFDLIGERGQISLYPETGFVGGNKYDLYTYANDHTTITGIKTEKGNSLTSAARINSDDLPNANFWIDMEGNAFFKGNGQFTGNVYANDGIFNGIVHATDGEFTGKVTATEGEFNGTVNATDFQLNGVSISGVLNAFDDGNGNLDRLEIGDITIDGETGSITFGADANVVLVKYSTDPTLPLEEWDDEWDSAWDSADIEVYACYSYNGGTTWTPAMRVQSKNGERGPAGSSAKLPSYIKTTYIDEDEVAAPAIYGNTVYTNSSFVVAELDQPSGTEVQLGDIYGMLGFATGLDVNDEPTYGVAMADGDTIELNDGQIEFTSSGRYIIVTNKGIRLQAGSTTLTLTASGAYYNGLELGIGGEGGGVAVFG